MEKITQKQKARAFDIISKNFYQNIDDEWTWKWKEDCFLFPAADSLAESVLTFEKN
jgi:hypothetical protein